MTGNVSSLPSVTFEHLRRRNLCAFACRIAGVFTCFCAIFGVGQNLGVDFTGGYTMDLAYQESTDLTTIRTALEATERGDPQVQNFGNASSILTRIASKVGLSSDSLSKVVLTALEATSDSPISVLRVDHIGPQVGVELREKGGLTVLAALGAIAVYVWIRYEKKFAVGAILAAAHDVVVTVGFFALFGIEFDLTVLAALLAVIAYSLNDTIVVFDRIRENFRSIRGASAEQVMNEAINQTLSRTVITSCEDMLSVEKDDHDSNI